MDILSNINLVTVLIAGLFIFPILIGIIRPLTSDKINRSLDSLRINLILLASIILSIYLTRLLLAKHENFILTNLYEVFPELQSAVQSNDILVYIVFIVVLFLLVNVILLLLTLPLYRHAFVWLSEKISSKVKSMNAFSQRFIGGLWQLPKSIWLVLVFSLLLNFYTGFFNSNSITEYADDSAPYRLVQENMIQPLLNNSVVKNIQIILDDSFKAAEDGLYDMTGKYLIKYFNGMSLQDAVQSNPEIDAEAKKIVGSETDDKQKAYLIYLWICKHITYDNNKAEMIANDSYPQNSGAIVAYSERTGICFDYSCLYVAMCRAVDLRVRFITGLGYSGINWGDHAWNQVYDPKQDIWIDVDTTFGSLGIDYFGRARFYLDHQDGVVQGEW